MYHCLNEVYFNYNHLNDITEPKGPVHVGSYVGSNPLNPVPRIDHVNDEL